MVARLRRFFDIRPGEGLPVLLSFTYIGVVIASYVLARAIRNGLFIEAYGPYALVYVAAASPVVLSLFVPAYTIARRPARRRAGLPAPRCSSSASTSWSCWYAVSGHEPTPRLTRVFYVWVNCFGVIAPGARLELRELALRYTSGQAAVRADRFRRIPRGDRRRLSGPDAGRARSAAPSNLLLVLALADPVGAPSS